jgi:cbb3-type cytochrome oxidase subunit 3
MIELLSKYGPIISTIFFFLAFCYIIYSVFKKGSKQKFDKYSKIPLKENGKVSKKT